VCGDKECGVDGCGVSCGQCPYFLTWEEGQSWECVEGYCVEWWDPWDDMVEVPAGEFIMGPPDNEQVVYVDGFRIDETETSEADYCGKFWWLCSDDSDLPKTDISWDEAKEFCEATGRRLCTDAEWEKAARGTDGANYGFDGECQGCLAGCCGPLKPVWWTQVDSPGPYGTHHMIGNAAEWVDAECPAGKQVRGGSFLNWYADVTAYFLVCVPPAYESEQFGVRCCADI
jgi:formylglycine-generating enzyme required for sulfatase activity